MHNTSWKIGAAVRQTLLAASVSGQIAFWPTSDIYGDEPITVKKRTVDAADDLSDVNDPNVLLDRLAQAKLQHLWLMTAGPFFLYPKMPPNAMYVKMWEKTYAAESRLEPEVRRLIEMGERAVPRINERLKSLDVMDPMVERLALALCSTGDADSVSALIEFLGKFESLPNDKLINGETDAVPMYSVTVAIWRLTGRQRVYTGSEWRLWWTSVQKAFVPLRDRQRPEFIASITAERVEELVTMLASNDVPARERLILLGPTALPFLLKALAAEIPDSADDQEVDPAKMTPLSRRLAWVIDELGGTDKLPAFLRIDYFTERLAKFGVDSPVDDDAACRAVSNCSFAEICSICLNQSRAADKLPSDPGSVYWKNSLGRWINMNSIVFNRRLGSKPRHIIGDPANSRFWNQIRPAESPTEEVAAAVPVLISGLDDPDASVRISAAWLAGIVGLNSNERPGRLIVSLRDHWLTDQDAKSRWQIGNAMTRFTDLNAPNPLIQEAVIQGLLSERPEIVSDSASFVSSVQLKLNDKTRPAFDKLIELTRHENDKLRVRAVNSLRHLAPKLLEPELERLASDTVDDIRQACAAALMSNPDPKFADLLFKLANDKNEHVRVVAFGSIGRLKHPESMKRLVPFLKDQKTGGLAVSALAQMGGKDSVPLLVAELEAGNDVFGLIYQHLQRLTGERFENHPDQWIKWWKKNQPAATSDLPKKD